MTPQSPIAVYTPDNEPYLGRQLLKAFDDLLCAVLDQNLRVAPQTHKIKLSDLQEAACRLAPQAINIALSIRELIRQGYLFGAKVLIRPLVERAIILWYLHLNPGDLAIWKRGWTCNEAPSLSKMIDRINKMLTDPFRERGSTITAPLNSILHGKPDSAIYSVIQVGADKFGHTPSKILNNPTMCDDICCETIGFLALVSAMINGIFPEETTRSSHTQPSI